MSGDTKNAGIIDIATATNRRAFRVAVSQLRRRCHRVRPDHSFHGEERRMDEDQAPFFWCVEITADVER